MAKITLTSVEKNKWYLIGLYADHAKQYERTIEPFKAKFDGIWWVDEVNRSYNIVSVFFIEEYISDEILILPLKGCENNVVVSAGGLDIKVTGCNVTFTIGKTNWQMSVAELEAMLESHDRVVGALRLTINLLDDGYVDADVSPTVALAKEALKRAD